MDFSHIDTHKVHLHPRRVADWLEGKKIAPIYMEISPSGLCNHRCSFCAMDFMGYKNRFLPTDTLCQRLREFGEAGVKSIMFAGEGEPLLHKDIGKIALCAKESGIDIAFTTNAVHLKPDLANRILPITSWIKVSCNAGTKETYAKIHGTKQDDFNTVLKNLEHALNLRKPGDSDLGLQMVLLPENQSEVLTLAKIAKDLGVDYLVIKPYSHHAKSKNLQYQAINYTNDSKLEHLEHALQELCTENFQAILRQNTIKEHAVKTKKYTHCMALPFWAYLDSSGQLWACLDHLGDEHFLYGNALEQSFEDCLNSTQYASCLEYVKTEHNLKNCRSACRMNHINNYLWELKNLSSHANFI